MSFLFAKNFMLEEFSRPSNVSSHNGSERIDEKLQQISYNSVEDITDDIRNKLDGEYKKKGLRRELQQ